MTKRDIFNEMMEGVSAMIEHREGKLTLRSYKVDVTPLPRVDSKMLRDTKEEAALLASGLRAQAADQRRNAGKMGKGPRETELSGGGAGAAGAEISGYAGAAG